MTPPLLAKDALYAGRSDGTVVKMSLKGIILKTFNVAGAVTAGPVMGPSGQILVGTLPGYLYSLTSDLDLRWQRPTGAPILGIPAFTSDALYSINLGGLQAYHPHSGETLWSRHIAETVAGGSVAVGSNRHLIAYSNQGHVVAYGEGWMYPPQAVKAEPMDPLLTDPGLDVHWSLPDTTLSRQLAVAATAAYTPTNLTLQRSEAGGPWQSIATLPADATRYSDTNVAPNTTYTYRLQFLEAEGFDSDFAFTAAPVQSLPAPPQPPTLLSATAVSAEAITLGWTIAESEVVTSYRLERSLSQSGPFTAIQEVGPDGTSLIDAELSPGTGYSYRLVALNAAGESSPSNILSETTYQQTLPEPQEVVIQELPNGELEFQWAGAPQGAETVIEYALGTFDGYLPLATVSADQPYYYESNFEEPVNLYRLKLILNETESPYVTVQVTRQVNSSLYLPVVIR
jgi:hypothetical protein